MAKKFVEPEYDVYKVDEVELVLERDFYIVGNNKITSSSSAAEIFRQFWNENLINIQEQFSVMLLSQSNKVIGMYQHSKGAINSTIADIELIAAVAVKSLAKGVIVAHNHPSGALTPSQADITLTKRLKEALALFQINLIDSLIIVQDKTTYYSLLDSGDFADGGVIIGDNSVKEEYIIKDGVTKEELAKGGATKDKKYLYKTKVRGAFGEYYIVVNAYDESDALERTQYWVAQERGKFLGKPIKTNEKFVDGLRMVENQYWRVFSDGGMMEKGGKVNDELEEAINSAKSISKNEKTKTYVFDYEFDRYSGKPNSNNQRYTWGYQEDVDYHKEKGFEKFIKVIHVFENGQKVMMNGGLLDVGKYYRTKSGKQVRYLGKTKDPEVGTFTNKTDGVSKIRYDEIEGKASLFAKGGYMAMGGKTFEGKVKSIKKSLLERKKVPKSVQKDYGKTFSPKEAEDSAKRIVGSLTARERMKSKMKK
jgi:hypothetical protein